MKQEDPAVRLESPGFSRGEEVNHLIPEPGDGALVVIETADDYQPLKLYWRDDTAAKGRTDHADERWFDDPMAEPLAWTEALRYARKVFRVSRNEWGPLAQPDDPDQIAVRLVVEEVVQDVEYDRDEFDEAKNADELDHLVDADVSDMDGTSVIVEADGTEHRPF